MPCPFVFVISEGSSLKSTLFMLQLENEIIFSYHPKEGWMSNCPGDNDSILYLNRWLTFSK